MSEKIKSYKLSPQLRSELNFSQNTQKKSSAIFNFNRISFKPNLENLPWKGILAIVGIFAAITLGYLGVKKGYEYTARKNDERTAAQLTAYNQRLENIKKD